MAQSLAKNYIHLVFSTQDRRPFLTHATRPDLFAYITNLMKNMNCAVFQVGGVEDHIHVLFSLDKNIALSKFVNDLKTNSSKWLKTKSDNLIDFAWQRGYGAFSVSQSDLESVKEYIQNQVKHHEKMSFQDELRTLLKRYKVDFDEKYLWD
jgi:REP element-mobilizing transposase RayT